MDLVQAIVWMRTELIKDILLEFEDQILYWRGREIARMENLSDYHRLQHFFIQKGLGILEYNWIDDQVLTVCITNSPLQQENKKAQKAIALEAGIITETIQLMNQMKTNGTAKWVIRPDQPPYIEVTIVLEKPRAYTNDSTDSK